jgi:hypothetical protein
VQESRLSAPRGFTGGAFVDHALRNQLLHQNAYHSPGHIQVACQISTRDGLMFPDHIESDAPVYVARSGSRGNPEVSSVNFAHCSD